MNNILNGSPVNEAIKDIMPMLYDRHYVRFQVEEIESHVLFLREQKILTQFSV